MFDALGQFGFEWLADRQAWLVSLGTFVVTWLAVIVIGRALLVPPIVGLVQARNRQNPTLIAATRLYLRVLVVAVGVPLGLVVAGYGGVISGSGVVLAAATLALGVAGQAVIGNLVSGLFLVSDPDFSVGDYIEWGEFAGRIEQIDFRATRVRTKAGETLVVPNTELTTGVVRRPYARRAYRVTESLTVAYETDLPAVRATLREVAAADSAVAASPAPTVHVTGLADDGVELTVWFWLDDPASLNVEARQTAFRQAAVRRLLTDGVSLSPASQRELSGVLAVTAGESGVS